MPSSGRGGWKRVRDDYALAAYSTQDQQTEADETHGLRQSRISLTAPAGPPRLVAEKEGSP